MSEPILFTYVLDGHGGGIALSKEAIPKYTKGSKPIWIHLDANHQDTSAWLTSEGTQLDPFIVQALLAEETRPRMMQVGNGALVILRGVNLNENAAPEDMVSIRLWIDEQRVISIRRRRLKAVWDIEEKIRTGEGPKSCGQLLCMLVSRLFERMEPTLSKLDETTDDIEEKVLEIADITQREVIINVRKQAIIFRRYMAPQRDAIAQLQLADLRWLDNNHRRQLQESHNHVTRYIEDLDTIRERAQIVKDELANILTDKLNKNMYILSVIAAIFLPLGFLTGLLGINVGGIPGAENTDAFWIFFILLFVIALVQVVIFKRLKWF